MPNSSINHSYCKEIYAFYSQRKGAKRVCVKGLDEYLDVETESSDGGDSFEDDDAIRVGDVPRAAGGDGAHIQSPSPECRHTSRGEPT